MIFAKFMVADAENTMSLAFSESCLNEANKILRGNNMLKDAKVVTSKFLQLRDDLNKELQANQNLFGAGMENGFNFVKEANINTLQKSFGKLCELLHELTVEDGK